MDAYYLWFKSSVTHQEIPISKSIGVSPQGQEAQVVTSYIIDLLLKLGIAVKLGLNKVLWVTTKGAVSTMATVGLTHIKANLHSKLAMLF